MRRSSCSTAGLRPRWGRRRKGGRGGCRLRWTAPLCDTVSDPGTRVIGLLLGVISAVTVRIVVLHGGQQSVSILRASSAGSKVRRQPGPVLGSVDSGRE